MYRQTLERFIGIGEFTKYRDVNATMNAEGNCFLAGQLKPQPFQSPLQLMRSLGNYGWQRKDQSTGHQEKGGNADEISLPNFTKSIKMSSETYLKLHKFYAPYVKALQNMAQTGVIVPLPGAWVREWGL